MSNSPEPKVAPNPPHNRAFEYFFCSTGIRCSSNVLSHPAYDEAVRIKVGTSKATGQELLNFMSEHFTPGSYDFLRKNCNSFTDCALYFLCQKRLDLRYRAMEKLGWMAESQTGLLHSISEGEYTANPAAEGFNVEEILEEIAELWDCEEESEPEAPSCGYAFTTVAAPTVSCWPPMLYQRRETWFSLNRPLLGPRPTRPPGTGQDLIRRGLRKQDLPSEADAIVIGAGPAGLSLAVLLGNFGRKVLVLEQHDRAGGGLHSFTEHGYEFETGFHYLGEMQKGAELRSIVDSLTNEERFKTKTNSSGGDVFCGIKQ
eukprot:g23319.t1